MADSQLILPPAENTNSFEKQIVNSFGDVLGWLGQGFPGGGAAQTIDRIDTMALNVGYWLISNYRQLLSEFYTKHGIIQTLIDQPVDDGFRAGFDIKTSQLDPDEIEELEYFCEENQVIAEIMQGLKWMRLFGGGAIIVLTGDNPRAPLKAEALKEGHPFKFRSCDLWELYNSIQNVTAETDLALDDTPEFFDYYGIPVHRSRVMLLKGKRAPSFIRPRLRGWGMSEVERMIRSLNSYLKNQDVIFELLDEAKVDVYKFGGLNASLLNADGSKMVAKRAHEANQFKNFQHAIMMDKNDEYEQKQLSFSGLAEMLLQIRQGVAADVKMPMTKLFGISAAGFNSGEDDIENYNSMIESEVRAKVKFIMVQALQICCQIKFGFIPDDLKIIWKPLRILGADEEEKVKDSQWNRLMSGYQSGLIPAEEAKAAINKATLLPVEVDEKLAAAPPIAGDFDSSPRGMNQKPIA